MSAGPGPTGPVRSWSPTAALQRQDRVFTRRLPDGLLVLDPHSPQPIVVTGPAADVWPLVAAPTTFDDAVRTLAERYAVDAGIVAADLEPVWSELVARSAIGPP
jgi:hypothetical protein